MGKLYVNIDNCSTLIPFLNYVNRKGLAKKEELYLFVDGYRNTQVTDILFNIAGQISNVDSNCWTTYKDKYEQKEENGFPVDYTEWYQGIYTVNQLWGIDPFKVWIERCQENGIRPWISFRMNDCHEPDKDTSLLRSDFFYEARKNGWMLGEKYGYFRRCLDFKIPQVRRRLLAYIAEQLGRYDVYGIELDFMREILCFRYLEEDMKECTCIMNDFMRQIKRLVNEAEQKHGHSIKIAVRLLRSLEQCRYFGFDPVTWAKDQLMDLVIPTPRWWSCDSGIPILAWKEALPGIEIVPGIETMVNFANMAQTSAAVVRGLAAGFLSQEADGIYLYNYFDQIISENPEDNAIPGHSVLSSEEAPKAARDREVQRTCAETEEIFKHPVRFAVISQSDEGFVEPPQLWKPLPMELSREEKHLEIVTGQIPKEKRISLIIGISSSTPENIKVSVNGVLCKDFAPVDLMELPGIGRQPAGYVDPDINCFICHLADGLSEQVQKIFLCAEETAVIHWVELVVV